MILPHRRHTHIGIKFLKYTKLDDLKWITGVFGLFAALITGAGEFLLHFDPQARFTDGLAFFAGISESRSNWGQFLGAAGAPRLRRRAG